MGTVNGDAAKKTVPPYVSWRTFVNFLDSLKVAVPSRIDRSIVPSMSGGNWSYLIGALRFMRLVDGDDVPLEMLKLLAASTGNERKEHYRKLFESTYGFLLENGVEIAQTTPDQLQKALQEAGATGDTVTKCRSFFLSLAKDAGIELSPYLKRVSRQARTARKRTTKKHTGSSQRREGSDVSQNEIPQEQSPQEVLYSILDPEIMSDEEQKAVWTLMMYLKKQEMNT
ncbi:MAG: DUF5343 domain-containing protein [candidate division Zixibacteria bacterium]|nr:DUF5343 domain-containing protein [candidate division Zixibacteria bacterium]